MNKFKNRKIILPLLAVLLFSLLACAAAAVSEAAPENTAVITAPPEQSVSNTDIPEEAEIVVTSVDMSLELPAPLHEHILELRETLPKLPDIDPGSWEYMLISPYNSKFKYEPKELGLFEGQALDSRISDAAAEFMSAVREQGYQVYVSAAYRNYEYLSHHFFARFHQGDDLVEGIMKLDPPGVSEHQSGLCFDVTEKPELSSCYEDFEDPDILDSDVYKWMSEHCADYGFIVRYPEGKEVYYLRGCDRGHFRYVGKEAAEYITENKLCLEEFLAMYDESLIYVPESAVK